MPLESPHSQETSQQTWEKTFEQKINRSSLSKKEKEKAKVYISILM